MKTKSEFCLTISIVSHGQGALVKELLNDLDLGIGVSFEVIITINISENLEFVEEYSKIPITIIKNERAAGFGANHNAAYKKARGEYFAVVNPDIRLKNFTVIPLLEAADDNCAGVVAPLVRSGAGQIEDSARKFPTPSIIARRKLCRSSGSDYSWDDTAITVDWVAGMFMLFNRSAFDDAHGFDPSYFMYLEDADICLRLKKLGYRTILEPKVTVIHQARRASRRNVRHFLWHISSLLIFFRRHL